MGTTIPRYRSREQLPGGLGGPRRSITGAGVVGRATQQLGKDIQNVAEELKNEHDIASTQTAVAKLRSDARAKMQEMLAREGAQAQGSMNEYLDWYDKRVGEVSKDLESNQQQILFTDTASRRRELDLDVLAKHQATEHRRHLNHALTATVATAEQDIVMDPTNDKLMRQSFADINLAFQNAKPGVDNTAEILRVKAGIKTAALQAMMQSNPEAAAEYVEKWKEDLGAAYGQLKNSIDTELRSSAETRTEENLKQTFGLSESGYDQMIEWLAKPKNWKGIKGFDARSAQWLANKLEGEITFKRHQDEVRRAENEDKTLRAIFDLYENGDISAASKILRTNRDITPETRWRLEQAFQKAKWETDPAVDSQIIEDIHAGKIQSEGEILSRAGNGLSTSRARSLVTYWKNQQPKIAGLNYISLARKMYKNAWISVGDYEGDMELFEDDFIRDLAWYIEKDNLKGDEILAKAKDLIGIIEPGWIFDTVRSPFLDVVKKRTKDKHPWEIEQSILTGTADIPSDIRNEIIGRLTAAARRDPDRDWLDLVTVDNILYLYRKDYPEASRRPFEPTGE